MGKKICVLVSGGPDSCALIHLLSSSYQEIFPLYIRMGLRFEEAEIYWLKKFLKRSREILSNKLKTLSVLNLSLANLYNGHWSVTGRNVPNFRSPPSSVYLPNRNLFLLSMAALFCVGKGIQNIAIGTLSNNPFSDATRKFFREMEVLLRQSLHHPFTIQTPLLSLKKGALIRKFSPLPWELTFSCINPQSRRHCGFCEKCSERKRSFFKTKIQDPTEYRRR